MQLNDHSKFVAESHAVVPPVHQARNLHKEVALLNAKLRYQNAKEVIKAAQRSLGQVALVSSFGAESVVLLHLVSEIDKNTPVIFVDTEMLFPETLAYQTQVSKELGLTNVQLIRAADIASVDPDNTLHKSDTDACCDLRKTRPLQKALRDMDGWITGRKRFQSGQRATLEFFEVEAGAARVKVNPLIFWSPDDIKDHIERHNLPKHPMVARGYPSIGCAPCTSQVKDGENFRAGRWRDESKEECGIHFVNGKMVRVGDNK